MEEATFELSTKIYYGTNIIEKALKREEHMLSGRILVVTSGRSLEIHGYLPRLVKILEGLPETEKIVVYNKVSANPRLEEVQEAVALGKKEKVQKVIGFGGGSALDAAKAAAVGIASEESIEAYLMDGKEPTEDTLPIIAIPTTAGTGSELSKGAIISSSFYHVKAGIRGKNLLPRIAVVDAAYTWTVPKKITLETGFDVLAHAIESYMSVKANSFSEMFSERAIKTVCENIILLYNNLNNHKAREKMSFASMIMGMNLANVGTCLPHRMQYAIGACTESSHAYGLIALYPSWIQHEFEVNPKRLGQVLQWMGFPEIRTPIQARYAFDRFLRDLDVLGSLSEIGIEEDMVDMLSEKVTGNLANDRLSKKNDIVKIIFRESIGGM